MKTRDFIGTIISYVIIFTMSTVTPVYGQYRDGIDYYYIEFKDGNNIITRRYEEDKNRAWISNALVDKKRIKKVIKITAEEARNITDKKEEVKQQTRTEAAVCQTSFDNCIDNTPVFDQVVEFRGGYDGIGRCEQYVKVYFEGNGKYGFGKIRVEEKINKKEFWSSSPVNTGRKKPFNQYKANWEAARDEHKKQCKLNFDKCREVSGLNPVNWSGPDMKLYDSIYHQRRLNE